MSFHLPKSQQSPQFKAALIALRELSPDERGRAFATVEQEFHRARDKGRYGESVDTENPVGDFLFDPNGQLMVNDHHAEMRINKKGQRTLQYHPYVISGADLRQLVRSMDKYRLDIEVTADSSYFPSRTLAIYFRYLK